MRVAPLIAAALAGLMAAQGPSVAQPAAPATPPAPPSAELDRGRTAFARGQYAQAIEILTPLLYPEPRLETEGEIVQAHRMLGVADLFVNRPEDARREFRRLLQLRPDYRFDPLLDPPRVVDFFNDVLREVEAEVAAMEAKRRRREAEVAAERRREAERQIRAQAVPIYYERRSRAIAFIPFGAGQFQNGHRRKAWTLLGIEAALGAVSVGAFVTNFALFGVRPVRGCLDAPPTSQDPSVPAVCQNVDTSDERLSHRLMQLQVASGALFFAVAAWGIYDALKSFEPLVRIDAPSTNRRTASVRITPAPIAGGAHPGLGAALSFTF